MRLFLKTTGERYKGDKRKAILRILRDLATNRAVFIEILTSDSPSDAIEQQMIAYLERNQGMAYDEPVSIPDQISVIKTNTPLMIVEEGIRLISDSGTSGHYNKAIDAGEVITLNIPLMNISDDSFRSTSGFIQTEDKYVSVGNSEVLYTERSEINGQTVTFAPGKSIQPSQHFVFTLSPDCPDGHEIAFSLLAWDSDKGKYNIPFTIKVYHVGPLTFGSVKIDDDIPGRSDGNGNQVIEAGETIEYILAIKNQGQVNIDNIKSTLISSESALMFKKGDDVLKYSSIPAESEKPISANFVFTVQEKEESYFSSYTKLRLFSKGESRSKQYSWITVSQISIKVNDQQWESILSQGETLLQEKKIQQFEKLLTGLHLSNRIESPEAKRLRSKAKKIKKIEFSKKKNIYGSASRIKKGNTTAEFDIINKERIVKNRKGIEHKIKMKIVNGKRYVNHEEGMKTYYEAKNNLSASGVDLIYARKIDVSFSVDDKTSNRSYGYRGNNARDSRRASSYPLKEGYIDIGDFRLVYTKEIKEDYVYYYVFIFRLDYGKEGVPTSLDAQFTNSKFNWD